MLVYKPPSGAIWKSPFLDGALRAVSEGFRESKDEATTEQFHQRAQAKGKLFANLEWAEERASDMINNP
jgi:hypothetical protein